MRVSAVFLMFRVYNCMVSGFIKVFRVLEDDVDFYTSFQLLEDDVDFYTSVLKYVDLIHVISNTWTLSNTSFQIRGR